MGCACGKQPEKVAEPAGFSHATLFSDNRGRIRDFYDLQKLGQGDRGLVYRARHKQSRSVKSVLAIRKSQVKDAASVKEEVGIMRALDHPNILKLFETFEDPTDSYLYFVLELCTGGDLFDRIVEAGYFTEAQAAHVMQQIFRAVSYMHGQHVCHRDIKPENCFFISKEPIEQNVLKVTEFGIACKFEDREVLSANVGTPLYCAPQVLERKYDSLCDLWSCGVVMYTILCGYPPFSGDDDRTVLQKVRKSHFSFDREDWKNVSGDAKDLVTLLLKRYVGERCTAEQALNHRWFKTQPAGAEVVVLSANLLENLRSFRSQHKLKKAALQIVASQLSEEQTRALREIFLALDHDGNGVLSAAEMRAGLSKVLPADIPEDLQQILEGMDANRSGVIDYTEFLAAALDECEYLSEERCRSVFCLFDADGDGLISPEELKLAFGNDAISDALGPQAVQEIVKEVDTNGDNRIDFQEFMIMMRKENGGSSDVGSSGFDGSHKMLGGG